MARIENEPEHATHELPERWLLVGGPKLAHRPHGVIALKRMTVGSGRTLEVGDILAEDDPYTDGQRLRNEIAFLPLHHGALAVIRHLQRQVARLEAELAEAKSE